MTQTEKFQEIADAIRTKTFLSDTIIANHFASEIRSIDAMRPMTLYEEELDNGYWGNKVALVAMSYQLTRMLGNDSFAYAQSNLFSSLGILADDTTGSTDTGSHDESEGEDDTDEADKTSGSDSISSEAYVVRNAEGKGLIDCSAFVGLVLRGITYNNSPYSIYKTANATWSPWKEMLYGTDGWEYTVLDKQPHGVFTDLGFSGYSSLPTAADQAEFFYKVGYLVFDAKTEGDPYPELYKKLQPGDLIFWAKSTASANQKKRFRSISHVAVVAERTDRYWQVTTGSLVVLHSNFIAEKYKEVALILRPDYRQDNMETPIGENLIHYPWNYGATIVSVPSKKVDDENIPIGLTYTNVQPKANGDNGIQITGTSELSYVRTLKGSKYGTGLLHLSPGTYCFSGMEDTGGNGTGLALWLGTLDYSNIDESNMDQVDDADVSFTTLYRAYDGHDVTFTLTETADLGVRLYTAAGLTLNCTIYPSLVRTA